MDTVEEIKSRLDITDVVGSYIQLKKAGGSYKASCPFHKEKTPSFMVSREKQLAYCFSCNKGGDMFTFVQEIEGVGFHDAMKILAAKAGVEVIEKGGVDVDLKSKCLKANKIAADFYEHVLWNTDMGKGALEYLKKRGLKEDTIKEFQLGISPKAWDLTLKALKKKGINETEGVEAGLLVKKEKGGCYDRFRDRLMFPINNSAGLPVGFGGRIMSDDPGPKYLNSSDSLIYNKSNILYGYDKAKQLIKEENIAVVVEGYMDVIASHKVGVRNVVASSGTALTTGQVRLLKRMTKRVAFSFDADAAGLAAAERGIAIALEEGMEVLIVKLKDGKDPDECIEIGGVELWKDSIKGAISYMDFFMDLAIGKWDKETPRGKDEIASYILLKIKKIPSKIEQEVHLQALSHVVGVSVDILRDESSRLKEKNYEKKEEVVKKTVRRKVDSTELLWGILVNHPNFIVNMREMMVDFSNLPKSLVEKIERLEKEYISGGWVFAEFAAKEGIMPLAMGVSEKYSSFKEPELWKEVKEMIKVVEGKASDIKLKDLIEMLHAAEKSGDETEVERLRKEVFAALKK